jgi:hypothetical protein
LSAIDAFLLRIRRKNTLLLLIVKRREGLERIYAGAGAWGFYINDSLRSLITTGKGKPNQKENGGGKKASL